MYAPDCAADLGDARCGVDLAVLEENGAVTTVTDATTFESTLAQTVVSYEYFASFAVAFASGPVDATVGCGPMAS